MAFVNVNAPRTTSILSYKIVRFVGTTRDALSTWKQARVTRKRLEKLSDHQLRDIGLIRSQIADAARR